MANRNQLTSQPGGGPAVLRALAGGQITVADLRAAAALPEDAQTLIDNTVVHVGLDRLTLVADLLAEGLTFDIGQDFWGITQIQWNNTNEVGGAHRTMEPRARGEYELPDQTASFLPIYLTWDDFNLGIRTLRASQRGGMPLDTTLIAMKTRRVNEAIEDAAINGVAFNVAGNDVPGILNAPNVNAFTYGANLAWNHATKTGQAILDDVLGMAAMANTAKKHGPYNLYVNTAYGMSLNKNFSDGVTTFPSTVRARLEEMEFGGRNLRVRTSDYLPANRVVLVQMTSDVIDVVTGQQPTAISWETMGGLDMFWMVLACIVPRIKTTYSNQSGIVTGNI